MNNTGVSMRARNSAYALYRNKKWSLNFHDKAKSQILHTASFFLSELTVSTLLIILQSLLAPYQLLLHKKVYFYNIVMVCLTFY